MRSVTWTKLTSAAYTIATSRIVTYYEVVLANRARHFEDRLWQTPFISDAEYIAESALTSVGERHELMDLLKQAATIVVQLPSPNPYHYEWRRIAAIVTIQLLRNVKDDEEPSVSHAVRRLASFVKDNADLLRGPREERIYANRPKPSI